MKKLAITVAMLMGMTIFGSTFACDSTHNDQASASTASPAPSGTPAPVK